MTKVLEGKKGSFFLQNDTNKILDDITGLSLDVNNARSYSYLIRARKAFLESIGVKYYFLVAPNKECVLSDFLPAGVSLSDRRNVYSILGFLEESFFSNIVYPLDALKPKPFKPLTYPLEDTHWNSYGAYIAYRELMSLIGDDFDIKPVGEDDFVYYERDVVGDLKSKVCKDGFFKNISVRFKRENFSMETNGLTNLGGRVVTTNVDKELPTAIIFRDSFCSNMIPFLANTFSRCVFLHQPNIDYRIVEEEMPDIVISQQVERFLVRLPDDIGGASHSDNVLEKTKKMES
ncbi:hypothetical protein [Enterovibrio sp. FF113]|uniref:alginate O-acetyltransferase AlgX-related protein n=1 Tax=Enterovibrio sp. FF113 TaxID=3230010 RepID=UPI00352CA45E